MSTTRLVICVAMVCLAGCTYNPGDPQRLITFNTLGPPALTSEQRQWAKAGFSIAEQPEWQAYRVPLLEAIAWKRTGFGPYAAQQWMRAGFNNPADAARWSRVAGISLAPSLGCGPPSCDSGPPVTVHGHSVPESAAELLAAGMTPEDVRPYVDAGISLGDPGAIIRARQLTRRGLDYRQAAFYAKQKIGYSQIAAYDRRKAAYDEKRQRIEQECAGGKIRSVQKLLMASPYSTVGQCYDVPWLAVSQWLGPATALVDEASMIVDFPAPPQSRLMPETVVMSEGAYAYESVAVGLRTIPRVRVLMTVNANLRKPLPP